MGKYIYNEENGLGMSGVGTIICLIWRCRNKRAWANGGRNIGLIFGNISAGSITPFNLTAPLTNTFQRSTNRRRKCMSGWWSKLPRGRVSRNS